MVYSLLKDTVIDLAQGIVGFEQLRYFRAVEVGPGSIFGMLQSEEDPNVGFVVVSPFDVYDDYEFKLSDEIIEGLDIKQPEDIIVLSIITVSPKFKESTLNLVAPIVINLSSGKGRQFILDTARIYSIHAPLFPRQEGGE
jgi:Uncharacterized protein conserved in bacteria